MTSKRGSVWTCRALPASQKAAQSDKILPFNTKMLQRGSSPTLAAISLQKQIVSHQRVF